MFQLMHFVFDLLQTTKGCQRRFVNGGSFFEMDVLGK